ncbi:MAG TPA: tetratricopeptide repeat protein [Bryobacteraceae bacterium]|nr:tetratricopeptide repeat protein [Bryobacteraceae bacterium]
MHSGVARWFTAGLATLVLTGSIYLLIYPPYEEIPTEGPGRIPALERALRGDLASARRWCDLGDALADAERMEKADLCYKRAVQLAPGNALIQIRAVNFRVIHEQTDQMLPIAKRVLELTRTYDAILFSYFDRLLDDPQVVIAQMRGNREALRAYLSHAIAGKQSAFAAHAWAEVEKSGWADDKLAASYVNALVADKQYPEAMAAWVRYLGNRAQEYPGRNLVYNGRFESEPVPCVFDWMIQNVAGATVSRDGSGGQGGAGLRIDFAGTHNVDYRHVWQATLLPPGKYRLRASLKSDGITTNEGPHIVVTDPADSRGLAVTSDPVAGSQDWTPTELTFTVTDHTRLVLVRIARKPSIKFDNKIAGTLWVDNIEVVGQAPLPANRPPRPVQPGASPAS